MTHTSSTAPSWQVRVGRGRVIKAEKEVGNRQMLLTLAPSWPRSTLLPANPSLLGRRQSGSWLLLAVARRGSWACPLSPQSERA